MDELVGSVLYGEIFPYDRTLPITYFIGQQIQTFPDNIAVSDGYKSISYRELGLLSDDLAVYLKQLNVQKGDAIGIYFLPCVDMIIAILAILKAGACYVPMDASYPVKQIQYILEDSTPKYVLANVEMSVDVFFPANKIIDIRKQGNYLPRRCEETRSADAGIEIKGHDPAYIIYTSGSTGRPKGIMVPHQAVNNHMLWMQKEFALTSLDRILLKTPLTFDPSVWEIFLPLFIGAQLVVAPLGSHVDPKRLIHWVNHHQITVAQFVPTILQELLQCSDINTCNTLKWAFVGGESLGEKVKKLFFKKLNCNLVNLYGPAEATIDTTFHQVCADASDLNVNCIGKPIINTRIYVLNEQKSLCAIDEEGELYIAGDNLALGYINKDSLNSAQFLNDLYNPNEKMYKTGDIVRMMSNNTLEYIGRKDSQIKMNGVRIETNALTTHILKDKNIHSCFFEKKYNDYNHAYLVCYLLPKTGCTVNLKKLKSELSLHFPSFFLPKQYYSINQIPLTINGKIDFNFLHTNAVLIDELNISNNIRRNNHDDIEDQLMGIWSEILLLDKNNIHLDDNFFAIGGDSLATLALITQIEMKFDLAVEIDNILMAPTLIMQANFIRQKNILTTSPIICLQNSGQKTPIFFIHPIGGTIFWYIHLAHYLKDSRALYGIQDPGIHGDYESLDSIEAMALYYYQLIKKEKPYGPYILSGASFGGTVAIEIANLLKNNGDYVSGIILFDSWGIYPNELKDPLYFKQSMERQQMEWETKFKSEVAHIDFHDLFKMQQHRLDWLYHYKMDKIEHPLVLFKAQSVMPIFELIDEPYNHWKNYSNFVMKIDVPGNHETMFQKPYVTHLGKTLLGCLEIFDSMEKWVKLECQGESEDEQ